MGSADCLAIRIGMAVVDGALWLLGSNAGARDQAPHGRAADKLLKIRLAGVMDPE